MNRSISKHQMPRSAAMSENGKTDGLLIGILVVLLVLVVAGLCVGWIARDRYIEQVRHEYIQAYLKAEKEGMHQIRAVAQEASSYESSSDRPTSD